MRNLIVRERALRDGTEFWQTGQLAQATEKLEAVLKVCPGAAEAIFPLARALSESGDRERALQLLDEVSEAPEEKSASRLYRALILYDYGEGAAARQEAEVLAPDNALAQGLRVLVDFQEGQCEASAFPHHTLWLPDVSGRLLALLEERLYEENPEEADRLHQRLLCDPPPASESPDEKAKETRTAETVDLSSPQAWRKQLEKLFERGLFTEFLALHDRRQVQKDWHDAYTELLYAFSLLGCGEGKKALQHLQRLVTELPRSSDAHFLHGLALTRTRDRREAGWAFVRAARLCDTDLYHVLKMVLETRK